MNIALGQSAPPSAVGVPVAILGAGPVGLALALALAQQGVRTLVLEQRETFSQGSRAVCISQRSLDILQRLGAVEPFLAKGYAWSKGSTYYRDRLVLEFEMPRGERLAHPPMINLQQPYIEEYLYEAATASGLAEVRWNSEVTALRSGPDQIDIDLAGLGGNETVSTQFLVACDGARSFARASLGLRLQGTSYEGRYVIADLRMRGEQTGRRVWFDPPSNPGATVIMHCQPDDVVRVDYQLRDDEDADTESEPERVRARVKAHLDWIGERRDWELIWVSIYKAHSLTLDDYVHGRVLFAGDAAHLVPIFGVRGLNGGFEDANNLGWKLASVVAGHAGPDLLASYSRERVAAARQNMRQAEKSAEFITPPSRGTELMRNAALSLAVNIEFVRPLINPRQVMPVAYELGTTQSAPDGERRLAGTPCPNFVVSTTSASGERIASLYSLLGCGFTLLLFGEAANATPIPALPELTVMAVGHSCGGDGPAILDDDGSVARAFGMRDGGAVLVRPDAYIAACWREVEHDAIVAALARHLGHAGAGMEQLSIAPDRCRSFNWAAA